MGIFYAAETAGRDDCHAVLPTGSVIGFYEFVLPSYTGFLDNEFRKNIPPESVLGL